MSTSQHLSTEQRRKCATVKSLLYRQAGSAAAHDDLNFTWRHVADAFRGHLQYHTHTSQKEGRFSMWVLDVSERFGAAMWSPLFWLTSNNMWVSNQKVKMRQKFRIPAFIWMGFQSRLKTQHLLFEASHFSSEQMFYKMWLMGVSRCSTCFGFTYENCICSSANMTTKR